ncbi:zinc finger protein 541-like, partial [Silurus meridionalis]
MCCSSVLPGGGTNTELALHCLHEVQGDILAALDLLLVRGDYRTSCHPLSDYHYTGSDHWTAQEMRLFQKTLLKQTKDFQLIHQM